MLSVETERFAMEILHIFSIEMHAPAFARGMFNSRAYVIDFVWRGGYAKSTCKFLFLPRHAFIGMDVRCTTIYLQWNLPQA